MKQYIVFYLVYFNRKRSTTGTALFCERIVDYPKGWSYQLLMIFNCWASYIFQWCLIYYNLYAIFVEDYIIILDTLLQVKLVLVTWTTASFNHDPQKATITCNFFQTLHTAITDMQRISCGLIFGMWGCWHQLRMWNISQFQQAQIIYFISQICS